MEIPAASSQRFAPAEWQKKPAHCSWQSLGGASLQPERGWYEKSEAQQAVPGAEEITIIIVAEKESETRDERAALAFLSRGGATMRNCARTFLSRVSRKNWWPIKVCGWKRCIILGHRICLSSAFFVSAPKLILSDSAGGPATPRSSAESVRYGGLACKSFPRRAAEPSSTRNFAEKIYTQRCPSVVIGRHIVCLRPRIHVPALNSIYFVGATELAPMRMAF
jgi:hypothetical protein